MYTIKSNNIKFDIIVTISEVQFRDANGDTITWINNDYNRILINDMIALITGENNGLN